MNTRKGTPETREQAIHRLALRAKEFGIKIFVYDLGERVEYYATSHSRPATLHRVTAWSCDCTGFMTHQRCMHFAALLEAIGELPPAPEPNAEQLAALAAARAELARLEQLFRRGQLKTTASLWNLHDARDRVAELLPHIPDPYLDPPLMATAAD